MHARAGHQPVVAAVRNERDFEFPRERVHPPGTRVVAGRFVLGPRVAQADEQFDHGKDYGGRPKKTAHEGGPFTSIVVKKLLLALAPTCHRPFPFLPWLREPWLRPPEPQPPARPRQAARPRRLLRLPRWFLPLRQSRPSTRAPGSACRAQQPSRPWARRFRSGATTCPSS